MKKTSVLAIAALFFFAASCSSKQASDGQTPEAENAKQTVKPGVERGAAAQPQLGKVNWIGIDELEAKMKSQPRKVLVDLYTDWCGWCKRMDKATFQNPEIADYVNGHFYAVKFDAETKQPVKFKGKEYPFQQMGSRGTNLLTFELTQLNRASYPTIAFLDESLETVKAFPGYRDAPKFDAVVHYIEGNHYKNQSWEDFNRTFKSKIPPSENPDPRTRAMKQLPNKEIKQLPQK